MRQPNLTKHPAAAQMVRFKQGFGQRFIVTCDTEEEFDWSAPFARSDHGLVSVPRLGKFQQFCEGFGVPPVYLIDFPVASEPLAAELLAPAVAAGKAEVGVQLHPWVSPPFDEEVNEFNSFAGNLPFELEQTKLVRLRDEIARAYGAVPLIYRAGRYGVGPATAQILSDAGIAIDTSVRARFDYSANGGRNFRDLPVEPWWVEGVPGLIELPLTTVYWGMLRKQGPKLYPALWRFPKARGVLARLGLLERIPLTPEGVDADEAMKAIDIAIDDGLPILNFSFHSPSLQPGHTPYVRDEAGLDAFYDWWRTCFTYLEKRGIKPVSVREILENALA